MANDPKFDVNRYTPSKVGSPYLDLSDAYANNVEAMISFYHVPSGKSVYFKAFITAFNESYDGQWASENVFGRVDPIHTFQQVQRNLNFTFKIPAASKGEAYENLGNIQKLIQSLYPTYRSSVNVAQLSQSPLIRLKIMNIVQDASINAEMDENRRQPPGDLFEIYSNSSDASRGLLGTVNNLSINHNVGGEEGVIEKGENTILPKLIEITCDFTAIHEGAIGWTEGSYYSWADPVSMPSNGTFPYNVLLENIEPQPPGQQVVLATTGFEKEFDISDFPIFADSVTSEAGLDAEIGGNLAKNGSVMMSLGSPGTSTMTDPGTAVIVTQHIGPLPQEEREAYADADIGPEPREIINDYSPAWMTWYIP